MSNVLIGIICFVIRLVLIFHGFPIAISMFLMSGIGFLWLRDWNFAILETQFANTIFNNSANYEFAVLPLFILLGTLAGITGIAEGAFDAIRAWLGRMKGGTLFTVIVANAIYGACSANSSAGAPSFVTTFAWDDLDDLVNKCSAFGTMNTAKYQAIGLNCTAVTAPECYDNLSRGIIDGCSSALSAALTNSLHEVAGYATVDGQYTSSVLIVANTEFWEGLSAEAQALLTECIEATSAYSAEHITQSTQAAAEEWKNLTGNEVIFMNEEDGKALWAQTLSAIAKNSANNAAGQAYEQDMMTLLTEWVAYQEEYHGIDIDF